MRRQILWFFIVLGLISIFVLPNYVQARCFCNMDMAGGEKGKKAQEKSARAAAFFFQAASTTFQMFRQIELHLTGEKDALRRAVEFSKQSREQLSRAQKEFDGVSREVEAIKAIDDTLRELTDYSIALMEAKVHRDSPIATSVIEAFKKGAIGALQMCSQSIKDLQDPDKPMGKVYRAVDSGRAPLASDLWDAIAQWNETLIRGRLISSIFTVRKK